MDLDVECADRCRLFESLRMIILYIVNNRRIIEENKKLGVDFYLFWDIIVIYIEKPYKVR